MYPELRSEGDAPDDDPALEESAPPERHEADRHEHPLELSSARHVESLVRTRGAMFLVTTQSGDITPPGARELGIFYRDTRFLSHYAFRVAGVEVAHLSAEAAGDTINQIDLMLAGAEEQQFLDDPNNYVHIRRNQLLDGAFVEELTFTSYLRRELAFELGILFGADFADIFEVRGAKRKRRGTICRPLVGRDQVTLRYQGLDGVTYTTILTFRPEPTHLTAGEASFEIVLAPGEKRRMEITVQALRGDETSSRHVAFDHREERLEQEARAFHEGCAHVHVDHGVFQQCLSRSEADLFALRSPVGDHCVVAAGIPWFCCPFGRDALLASYEALLLNPDLAVASLRTLAAYQGKRDDPFTEEEPGKILHELRFGEMARVGETPHTPYYGTVDATPLFVIVAHATYQATADLGLIRDLAPAIRAALGWIDRHTQNATTLLTYERKSPGGLDNQGWKDSRDAIVRPDGTRAPPPIALAEVQGYCVDAYSRGARLLDALGDPSGALSYVQRSQAMRALVERSLWLEDRSRYAFAIDGEGKPVDTVVSNVGHLLWSRVPDGAHARSTTDLLLDPHAFSGFGIRTLAAGQTAYNPLSYHNGTVWPHDNAIIARGMAFYGFREHVARIFEGQMAALAAFRDRRLPELFCGMDRSSGQLVRYPVACSPQAWSAAAPYLLLRSTFGLFVDAPSGKLLVRDPTMPPSLREVTIDNLRVGTARICLRFRRDGRRCHVDVVDVVGSVRTAIELS